MSDTLALPETSSYADWRDRFFTPDHPPGENKPPPHYLSCPCAKLTATWLFHPDLTLTQSQWQVYQGKQPGRGQIQEQRDRLHQSLIDHDLLPSDLNHLLFQTRLFGFTRRTLSSDLHHLATIGWLHNRGNKFQKVTAYPDYPHAGSAVIKSPSNQELALFTQPGLAAIADTFSRTFQGYTRFFIHVDYVISQNKLDRVETGKFCSQRSGNKPLLPQYASITRVLEKPRVIRSLSIPFASITTVVDLSCDRS